jgi:hypothetical protein
MRIATCSRRFRIEEQGELPGSRNVISSQRAIRSGAIPARRGSDLFAPA